MNRLGITLEAERRFEVGGMSVYPLTSTKSGLLPFLTGPEAFDAGLIEVDELDPPVVTSLAVTNLADVPVLLVEGEILLGGDQDRSMNVTVLCPALSTTVVPVSCVEAGRWGEDSRRDVAGPGRHAPGSLRAAKTMHLRLNLGSRGDRFTDQGSVWDEVDRLSMIHDVSSDTSALGDVQTEIERRIAGQLGDVHPLPGQIGVVCAIGTRVVGVDVFDRPSALGSYLRGIIAGHALDIEAESSEAKRRRAGGDPVRAIEHFLTSVVDSYRYTVRGVGLGEEFHLGGGLVGIGLSYGDALIHLAAFPEPA
ncbi:MAG TPA: DUF6569 family protein [Acidimicrobiales bacterium]|jgi:hypothetical protein|nr:DUF6569 family protein [Acidimicrobiales bacterium]HWF21753.1 DUF6569 family protein [Acidimicrobiales bacterium]